MRSWLDPLFGAFFDPTDRVFWPFSVGSVVLAMLVWVGQRPRVQLLRFLFPSRIWLHPSARLDYQFFVLKGVLRFLWVPAWAAWTLGWAVWVVGALDELLGTRGRPSISPVLATSIYTVVLFVGWDLSRYVFHRLFHGVPFLWSFHRVHHSAEVLTPLTLYRTHPVESFLYSVRGVLVTGTITGLFFYVFRERTLQVQLLGVNAIGFLFNLAGGNLRHSHVRLSYGPLEWLFLSPAQHQLHHARTNACAPVNYGTWLSLWDGLGGTLQRTAKQSFVRFGLSGPGGPFSQHSLKAQLLSPFHPTYQPRRPGVNARLPGRLRCGRYAKPWLVGGAVGLLSALVVSLAHAEEKSKTATSTTSDSSAPGASPGPADAPIFILDEPALSPSSEELPRVVDLSVPTVSIVGEHPLRIAGSAHIIDEAQLEAFEYNDIHRIVKEVPGVYVRGEDGYGLRPNIGLRGANSDRSAKVTLMEDGILFGPAPYSAPAAYYFPLTTRIVGVEVVKGPAAVRFGPHTIGGALNLKARPIPSGTVGFADLAYGLERFGKVHGYFGTSSKGFGVLVEGAHLQTVGFKNLDGGGDTGFDKNEITLRARYHTDPSETLFQQWDLKLGYSDEESDETYLGLSDGDFSQTPFRRYAASQKGLMTWDRLQMQATYHLAQGESFDLDAALYRHVFSRDWRKLNRFRGGSDLRDILNFPDSGQSAVFFSVLTGQEDSNGEDQSLLIGTNGRDFVSQGAQIVGHWRPTLGAVSQEIEVGIRFHYDRIERDHIEDGFWMRNGTLVPEGRDTEVVTRNRGSTYAVALHLHDLIQIGALSLSPGLRLEIIRSRFRDRLAGTSQKNSDAVLIPGVGVHYQLNSWLGLLAGVHQGFGPVSPGQSDDIKPEKSVNYEAGARVNWQDTKLELIGFFNDYENLTGECTLSGGCTDALLSRQFNGGEVEIFGLEAVLSQRIEGPWETEMTLNVSYTLTRSEFQTSFSSDNPQFGDVTEGDELAYVPQHQGALTLGVKKGPWSLDISGTYVGTMRDIAGQGSIPETERIDDRVVVDLASSYTLSARALVYLTVQNLLDSEYVLSRRPFGVRPGRPFHFLAGFKYNFGT